MLWSLFKWNEIQNIEQKKQKLKTKETEAWKSKTQKDINLVLPQEYSENADLHKPEMNKIKTTRK